MTDNIRSWCLLFVAIVSLSRSNCQEPNKLSSVIDGHDETMPSPKIVGGSEAAWGEYPAMISIQRRTRSHFCGGTLINENHVLTAAHCVTTAYGAVDNPSGYFVMGNSLVVRPLSNPSNQTRDATHVFVHPQYNSVSLANDIAVIRVSPPFTFTSTFYPAIRIENTPAVNSNCSVAGWGTISYTGPASSILLRVNITIIDTNQCNRPYSGGVGSGMVCAGSWEGGKDSCQGDSGGGLYCGNRLAGIVSFGIECARVGIPGVYTNVAYYSGFVNTALAWNSSHSSFPTPPTRRPSSASIMFISSYMVILCVYFVLVLR